MKKEKNMSEKSSEIVELLKYPVLVFSIVVALIIVKYSLNLEFGVVTEVSTDGLKFSEKSNKATLEAITELEAKLNDMSVRLAVLEKADEQGDERKSAQKTSWAKAEAFYASQAVSDSTARIAELNTEIPGGETKVVSGWMWIGNYDKQWTKTTISQLDTGQPIVIAPKNMRIGTQYRVLGNIVIRDGLPPNDKDYYKARKNLGVISRGSVVTLVKAPEPIDREFAVQYWAEVEYVTNSKK